MSISLAQPLLTVVFTAQSVTSDPKSFASDSVRNRWPVILVRTLIWPQDKPF